VSGSGTLARHCRCPVIPSSAQWASPHLPSRLSSPSGAAGPFLSPVVFRARNSRRALVRSQGRLLTPHRTGPPAAAGEFEIVRFRVLVSVSRRAHHESTRVAYWCSSREGRREWGRAGRWGPLLNGTFRGAPGSAQVRVSGRRAPARSGALRGRVSAVASQPFARGFARHTRCAGPPGLATRSRLGRRGAKRAANIIVSSLESGRNSS
jgi:hypothetical protein